MSFKPGIGGWRPAAAGPAWEARGLAAALTRVREPVHVVRDGESGAVGLGLGGELVTSNAARAGDHPLLATLPPLYPEWLGDRSFAEVHGVRFPYVIGEMANGIATARMVIAAAQAELLAFFGAAGLAFERVERAIDEIDKTLGDRASWGVNLIHSPNEAALEERVADLLVRRNVARIGASAFMRLTPAVVRCAAAGLRRDPRTGAIVRRHHVFAKVSRAEIATQFMSPPPGEMLRALIERGLLSNEEASLAALLPVSEDITVEADSGGHTDNRPLVALLPAILALRDELAARHRYPRTIRVGAAGGLGAPSGVAAAFALGAAYVLTGSINQAAVESGLSEAGKKMLSDADLVDVTMAPAADMFELGVQVQVLKRGTMFAPRAAKLYEVYRSHASLDELAPELRRRIEEEVLRASLDEVWSDTRRFWGQRDPTEVARAERDPKHKMALVFRWYLGKASRWAIDGEADRRTDYQIWCGPAMGAFNRWVAGSFLADPANRTVAQIARNLLEGAAVVTRAQQARTYGAPVPASAFQFRPRRLA